MHYQIEHTGKALRFTALSGSLPMSQYPADLFRADTQDFPAIPAAPAVRIPAGHRAPRVSPVRRAGRKIARTAAALWDGLPGPWPVKVILVGLAMAEPTPFGEMALGAYAAFMAARKARRTA